MGSTPSKVEGDASRRIDGELLREKQIIKNQIKLLLLGPSNSGKSTILKQMKILHLNGFAEHEIKETIGYINSNIINAMGIVIENMADLCIDFEVPDRKIDAKLVQKVLKAGCDIEPIPSELEESLLSLWTDKGVQGCFSQIVDSRLPHSAQYFLRNLERILNDGPEYAPTIQDILHVRKSTMDVVEIFFTLKNIPFRVIDVGGQRTERRKWIHQFENVQGIIFVIALSDYDLKTEEDPTMNRLHDAIHLFRSIAESEYFLKTSIIMFLNKKDIFEEKIKKVPLNVAFPKYSGANEFEEAAKYIQRQFGKAKHSQEQDIYFHQTCATDTNQIQFVLEATTDMIISQHLKDWGLY